MNNKIKIPGIMGIAVTIAVFICEVVLQGLK